MSQTRQPRTTALAPNSSWSLCGERQTWLPQDFGLERAQYEHVVAAAEQLLPLILDGLHCAVIMATIYKILIWHSMQSAAPLGAEHRCTGRQVLAVYIFNLMVPRFIRVIALTTVGCFYMTLDSNKPLEGSIYYVAAGQGSFMNPCGRGMLQEIICVWDSCHHWPVLR